MAAAEPGGFDKFEQLSKCPQFLDYWVNYNDSLGRTSLWWASHQGRPRIVEIILKSPFVKINKAKSVTGETPLLMASQSGHTEVVRKLLNHSDIDVDRAEKVNGATPLLVASQNGHVQIVKLLLASQRVNVNHRLTSDGATPLINAALKGRDLVVRELLAHRDIDPNLSLRNPDPEEDYKDTAIIEGAYRGWLRVVKLLIGCSKVKLGVKDRYGKTELDYAKERGYSDIVHAINNRWELQEVGDTCNLK